MWNREYTTTDSVGLEVKKGDEVTVSFTGTVRSVSRDGLMMIKCADGTITGFYPNYQTMLKLYPSIAEVLSSKTSSTEAS